MKRTSSSRPDRAGLSRARLTAPGVNLGLALGLALGLTSSAAWAQASKVVIPPIPAGAGVTAPIAHGFETQLRKQVAQSAAVVDSGGTAVAVSKSGFKVGCTDDDCARSLSEAADARFVLSAQVTNSDEIYTVQLSLYDRAAQKRTAAKEVCELCAVEEVDGSIAKAVASLSAALKAPAPAAPEPAVVKVLAPVALKVITTPPGAQVFLDDQPLGETPFTGVVAPGEHKLRVVRNDFLTDESTLRVSDRPITVELALLADPNAVVAVDDGENPDLPPAGLGAPAVAATAPVSSERRFTGVAVGMMVGGAVLAGVGTWLVALDGDITCDDGRSRAECPTVYNTKYVGVAGLGVGAGLVGAAIATLVFDGSSGSTAAVTPTADGGAMVQWGGQF